MAKISFVLVLSLMLALSFRTVLGQYSWDSVIDQAKQAGVSSETIDDAKKAVGDDAVDQAEEALDKGEDVPSVWDDFVKDKASSMGLSSPANAPAEEPLLVDDLESSPTEAPENSRIEAPANAGTEAAPITAPQAATPQAQTPYKGAPQTQTPYAGASQAQAPSAQAPSTSAPQAATPQAQAPIIGASQASKPQAPTPQAK